MSDFTFEVRLNILVSAIKLADNFGVVLRLEVDRFYFQIECYRKDVITGKMGWGYGGKAWLAETMTDSELVQCAFGLYKSYVEHEARETFLWRGRQVFGPHMDINAVWSIADQTDASKP